MIALAEAQGGALGHAQLVELGIPARTIQHWRESRWLHDWHRGVYSLGHGALSWRGRCHAALLAAGAEAAVAGASTAVLLGLVSERPTIDVIAPRRCRGDARLRIRRGSLDADETTIQDGIRTTTVERMLFDLADPRLVTHAIAKRLTSLDSLTAYAHRKRGARGATRFARAIGLPRFDSAFEAEFHAWLRTRGFPEPEVNPKIGRRRIDFVWRTRGVAVETDGPHHRTPAQRVEDERRDAEALRHGIVVLRVAAEGFDTREELVARELWRRLRADPSRPSAI